MPFNSQPIFYEHFYWYEPRQINEITLPLFINIHFSYEYLLRSSHVHNTSFTELIKN